SSFAKGARYRFVGVVGQRASKKGELDGYRVWVRDRRDVTLLTRAPSPSPSASSPGGPTGGVRLVSIATALHTTDRDVAIDAVVTAGARLLDGTGRRIVIQDATGAVEILLPKDTPAPGVGARVRAAGRIGTAYGAPRLRAASVERRGTGTIPAPLRIAGPLTRAHTWRLVSIAGRVDDVQKLGERWRAEVVVGATTLVVLAQPGARIPNTALREGGIAHVVGIVRPAYPSATDKRPSILPRSAADLRGSAPATSGATAGSMSSTTGPGQSGTGAGAVSSVAPAAIDLDLADLESALGSTVRVGGLVVDLSEDGFDLDDGTATGRVALRGDALDALALIEPADAINATGRVERQSDGEPAVVVADPASLVLGSALGAPEPGDGPSAEPTAASPADPELRAAGFADPVGFGLGTGAGLLGLLAIAAVSVGVTALRRRHGRRLLATPLATGLAVIGAGPPADRAVTDAPHGPSRMG
ncbi:MAG TPA: OB-fold nucleic acid binding domain-containing protein, partial [Candidatus Limnocylindrales bacterium]